MASNPPPTAASRRQRREGAGTLGLSVLMAILVGNPFWEGSGARASLRLAGVLEHAAEQTLELPRLRLAEAAQESIRDAERQLPHARIGRATLLGQLEMHQPTIGGTAVAADQALALQ